MTNTNAQMTSQHTGDAIAPDYWLDRERTYVASVDDELDNESTLNINVQNPPENTDKLYFYFGEITHSDDVDLTLHTAIDDVTGTTQLEVSNNAIGSDVDTVASVHEVEAFTSLDDHSGQRFIGGGTQSIFDGYRAMLLPGTDLVVEVESLTGGNFSSIRLAWADVPLDVGAGLT